MHVKKKKKPLPNIDANLDYREKAKSAILASRQDMPSIGIEPAKVGKIAIRYFMSKMISQRKVLNYLKHRFDTNPVQQILNFQNSYAQVLQDED